MRRLRELRRLLRSPERRPQHFRTGYRPDLDGLRAIAVLAVVAFHASPRLAPGGFIGVDIFFVISGFLISGILFTELADGTFEFGQFYARRARRIFPALAIVLAVSWAAGWFVLVHDEYRELEKHLAAGATFLSNFLLWREVGYFDAPAESKPLLHLWSLGVEEQFYLIWPPLLYVCWKRSLNIVSAVVTIIVASFLLNVALVGSSASAAFYSPQTRLWELLLGGLVAYVECFHRDRVALAVKRLVFASPDRHGDRFVANLKAGLGFGLIVLAFVALGSPGVPGWWVGLGALHPLAVTLGLDSGTAYPGWWATLPVVGTTLVIWAGANAWINRAILGRRILVYIGLMSYPLYLWHWPLLSFVRITEGGTPSRVIRASAVVLAFVLAWLTYEGIERQIRRTTSLQTPFRLGAIVAALIVIATASFYSYRTNAFTSRTPQLATTLEPRVPPQHDPACHQQFPTAGVYCQEYVADGKVTTALIGDSHAEHFLNAVGASLRNKHESVVQLGAPGCPTLLDVQFSLGSDRGSDRCREISDSVITYVANNNDLTRVIISFRGAVYANGSGFGDAESGFSVWFKPGVADLSPAESLRQALLRTVGLLLNRNKTVWLLLQVPELNFHVESCLARPFSFEREIRSPCAIPKTEVVARQSLYRKLVSDVSEQWPSLHIFDPMPFLCDERWCYAMLDGRLQYRDNQHLSRAGALFLSEKLAF